MPDVMRKNINADRIALSSIIEQLDYHCHVSVYDALGSTNDLALQQLREGKSPPFACFAESQRQGRGRRGKAWLSPSNSSIYMSLAYRFELAPNELARLSLVMALALARFLESIGVTDVGIKWPNDVLAGGKKIAGILIETARHSSQYTEAVIGVGLNYDLPEATRQMLDQPVTDVCSQIEVMPEGGRSRLAGLLLNQTIAMCRAYVHDQSLLMRDYIERYDLCSHKQVRVVLDSGEKLEGLVLGIADNGELRVKINGKERVFSSAEISIKI